jgi:site-specific DNA-methyltransferase (adenine-specific)
MPESVRDRFTKAHEQLILLSKSPRYYFDQEAVKEPATYPKDGVRVATPKNAAMGLKPTRAYGETSNNGTRNRRSVWTVSTKPYAGAHFATFPPDLIEPCVLAGCPVGGTVLDPFGGSGTTAGVAVKHGRNAVLCELNPAYAALVPDRVAHIAGSLFARDAAE